MGPSHLTPLLSSEYIFALTIPTESLAGENPAGNIYVLFLFDCFTHFSPDLTNCPAGAKCSIVKNFLAVIINHGTTGTSQIYQTLLTSLFQ